jgi:hypothetical protein
MLQRGQLWQNFASPQSHACVWNTTEVCTFTPVSALTSVLLALHMITRHVLERTGLNVAVAMTAHAAGI